MMSEFLSASDFQLFSAPLLLTSGPVKIGMLWKGALSRMTGNHRGHRYMFKWGQ